jgi:hypothetical protein
MIGPPGKFHGMTCGASIGRFGRGEIIFELPNLLVSLSIVHLLASSLLNATVCNNSLRLSIRRG